MRRIKEDMTYLTAIENHANALGLCDKTHCTAMDRNALANNLRADGWERSAVHISIMEPAELDDFLCNIIYG